MDVWNTRKMAVVSGRCRKRYGIAVRFGLELINPPGGDWR